ncbi:ATP-binding cassette domain-containing protein [Patescibacteria group bacterium]|nr:ATP-binding cassette domain-containing protein [Patescibacteria group bacterium]
MELKIDHIQKSYGPVTVIDDVSFTVDKDQKIGLVGNNGSGKSTLLKILAGIIEPDKGRITTRKGLRIGYMPQDANLASDETIRHYLRRVSGIEDLESRLETSPEAVDQYESRDGYAFESRMQFTLTGFGLNKINSDRPINTLSSGQKSKVLMAGVLLSDAELLLLDEPTNNLDLPALIWLEDFLSRSAASCIIVSHDRFFLDRVVNKIFELNWHTRTITVTNGKYSDYLEQLAKERVRRQTEYEQQQDETQRLTELAQKRRAAAQRGAHYQGSDNDKYDRGFKRNRAARSGKSARAAEKRIEHMEHMEKPIERDKLRIHIRPLKPGGRTDITLQDTVMGYPEGDFRLGSVTMNIAYGSRVAILGLNGSGKSTLLQTIGKELPPLSGLVDIGNALIVGNFMQEHDNLPLDKSLKNFLIQQGHLPISEAYAMAIQYGFSEDELDKPIGDFSPGGQSRILLAILSALSVNALLLDEPTNHLDIEALDALEEVITHYQGTIILVSHDRYFLEKFNPTDTYVITDGKLTREPSLTAYIENARREAKRLINML